MFFFSFMLQKSKYLVWKRDLLLYNLNKNDGYDVLQSSDLLPLAMVMLFDFQDRKFLWRKRSPEEGEERPQEVRDLESSLQK